MTKPLALVVSPTPAHGVTARPRHLAWMVGVLALSACTSVPLPEWPGTSGTTTTTTPAAPASPPAATAPAVSTSPISQSRVHALPYSAAVAALFPEPDQRYRTPGLAPERSSFTSNAELAELLQQLPHHSTPSTGSSDDGVRIAVLPAGNSQNGRAISAVLAAQSADLTPSSLDATQRPMVMIVAGQQGNAPASTEAVLALLQELDEGGLLRPMLKHINLLLVPRANPDGFETQQATTANGTDLRHDHLRLQTPEARALAQLITLYRPAVVLDAGEFAALGPTQTRFNATRANDMGVQYAMTANAHEFVTKAAKEWFFQPMTSRLAQAGLRTDALAEPTGNSAEAGFAMDTVQPTTLANIAALKNAIGLTVQSRGSDLGLLHAQRRVHGLVQAILSVLDSASTRARDLAQVATFASRDIASQACQGNLLVQAQGVHEKRELPLIDLTSGHTTPTLVAWQSALGLSATEQRSRPCGYWLSPEARNTAAQLDQLGLQVLRVAELSPLVADGYTDQGGHIVTQRLLADAIPGSYYVSLNQGHANLATALLEPDTPYSSYAQGTQLDLSHVLRVVTPAPLVFEDDE